MKKFILIFLLLISNRIFAQHNFSKMFDLFQSWESAGLISNYDSNGMVLTGWFVNPFNTNYDSLKYGEIFICSIDTNLNSTVKTLIGKRGINYNVLWFFNTGKNKILFIGTDDSLHRDTYKFIYITNNGDTIKSYNLETPSLNFYSTGAVMKNSLVYIFGYEGSVGTTSPFSILCVDTTGKKIWYKKYVGKRSRANYVISDDFGNFITGGIFWKGDGIKDTLCGWYAKLDTLGNLIWEKNQSDTSGIYSGAPYLFNHSVYFFGENGDLNKRSYAYMYKIDDLGNIIWLKKIIDGYVSGHGLPMVCLIEIAQVKNDYFYNVGQYNMTNDSGLTYSDCIQFLKLDSLGNIKWRRVFKQWYKDNRAYSLTSVPDGFIICADGKDTTHTTGYADAWVIKTDTNGCVIPGCNAHDGIVQIINPEAFVKVYPNPASTELNIEITDERAKAKNFFMYDNTGNLVTHKNVNNESRNYIFPTSDIKNGLYYFVIELQDGSQAVRKILIQK
ncbi:MAG: T9SS type A sorting domain-containing protein [Bacteroidota bacterium]